MHPSRHYGLLAALLALFAGLATYYSLVLPLGEATDETHHYALVRFIAENGRPPLTIAERQAIGPKGDASPVYHALVALLTQPATLPDSPALLAARGAPERFIPFDGPVFTQFLHTEAEFYPYRGVVLAWHLARLPSVLLGMVTLLAIYATVRRVFGQQPGVALAAVALTATLPRFVTSGAVVNDDSLALPLIAVSIYLLARIATGDLRPITLLGAGALAGLAAITKYHALVLLPEIGLLLALLAWRDGWGWPALLRRGGLAGLAFALTAGGWLSFVLVRFNEIAERGWLAGLLAALGDPVTTGGVAAAGAVTGLSWAEWFSLVFRSFWLEYGGMRLFAPAPVYWLLAGVLLLAVAGLLRASWRLRATLPQRLVAQPVWLVLLLQLLLYAAIVTLRYLALPLPETAQGRHLYSALSSVVVLAVAGGYLLLPRRSHAAATMAVTGGLLGLALIAPPRFFLPHIPYLPLTATNAAELPLTRPLHLPLADGSTLLGVTSPPVATAGQSAPVTLYWQIEAKPPQELLEQVCLVSAEGQRVACRATLPADGRYPRRAWESGFTLRDEIILPLPACLPPGLYHLRLALLPLRRDSAAAQVDPALPVPEPVELDQLEVTPAAATADPVTVWQGGQRRDSSLAVAQLRQSVAVVSVGAAARLRADAGSEWPPVLPPTFFACGDGSVVATTSFVADAAVAPGEYRLETGPSFTVQTARRNFAMPNSLATPAGVSFSGEMDLLGYTANLSPREPGQPLTLTAAWRGGRWMDRNYVAVLKLVDTQLNSFSQTEAPLGRDHPTVLWAPGETVSESYSLPLPSNTPPGLYRVEFGVLYGYVAGQFYFIPIQGAGPEAVEHLYLGPVQVLDLARNQPPEHAQTVRLGSDIELTGYDLHQQGRMVALALHWQATTAPAGEYTVFTQLLGPDGQVAAQQDNPPQAGRYPTTAWASGKPVVDRYTLTVPDSAAAGVYRLLVGMYTPADGQRLPAVAADGRRLPADAIELATLELK